MNKYVDYLNYRNFQKKSEDIGNILRPLGAPRVQPAEAPVNYRDPVVPQSTPRPVAPQPTPQPVATPYRPPVATRLPARDPLNRNMSEAQRFANGFNGVKSSGLMDKIPAGVMTNDDFADKEMMDYNKGLPSATSPTYAPNVPWEKQPRSTGGNDLVQSYPANGAEWAKGLPNVPVGKPTPNPTFPVRPTTPNPTFPVKPGLPTAMTNDDFADKEMMDYNKGLPSATSPTYAPKPAAPVLPKPLGIKSSQEQRDTGMLGDIVAAGGDRLQARSISDKLNAIKSNIQAMQNKVPAPLPTPTPMPAAPVLPKPLGTKIGQERQSKLNRYIKALELLNS